jgi:hypothetical protein
MSDKTGFISELTGELGKTTGDIVKGALSAQGDILKEAVRQTGLPIAEEYKQAKKAIQPRIDYLSHELKSLQGTSQHQQERSQHHEVKQTLSSPAKKKNMDILKMIKRADRKDTKQAAA